MLQTRADDHKTMSSPNTTIARLAAAQSRNAATTAELSEPTGAYANEYDRFIAWVDEHGVVEEDGKYITRLNVDLYFTEHVAFYRTGTSGTIKRIVQGLQWFSSKKENPGSGFLVENAVVKLALDTNKERQKNMETIRPGTDPHKGLKDVLPTSDRILIMDHIYGQRGDWGPASISFTWGNNAAVRGGSTRNLVFADWNLSRGFGPEEEGSLSRTLFLIMRKGGAHKDRFTIDQQVGCWRHKEYKLCSVFSSSMWALWNLVTERQNPIDFLHRDKTKRAKWWDTQLIDWNKYGDASSAMKQVYKATGVVNCKLTHDRTAAIQYAGAHGLAPHQINSFTNHLLEKLHRAYQAEADREVR